MSSLRFFATALLFSALLLPARAAEIHHAQGEMAGEPAADSILLQSRLTAIPGIGQDRSVPGAAGVARFLIDEGGEGRAAITTPWLHAKPENDFIVRYQLRGLKSDTRYRYRLEFGESESAVRTGPERWFRTLPGSRSDSRLSFLFFNCMGWGQYMDGYSDRKAYDGPDKLQGYPTLVQMRKYADSHFVIGGGDLVYYDYPSTDVATTQPQLRAKWQQQFALPRLVDLVGMTGSYWMKDDHDFRYDDGDLTERKGRQGPSVELGIRTFREQMPIVSQEDAGRPTYRTVRATRHVQIWMLEGRDYRSPNAMEDGPTKSIWGAVQKDWLKRTLVESDATWKLIVTPTPMVGPDSPRKRDNHTNPLGFRLEGEQFFAWMKDRGLKGVVLFTGDRHWQYHSIHPTGFSEFACGSLHREVAVGNPPLPGQENSTDPMRLVKQPYVTTEADGGFLRIAVEKDAQLKVEIINQSGVVKYVYETKPGS